MQLLQINLSINLSVNFSKVSIFHSEATVVSILLEV